MIRDGNTARPPPPAQRLSAYTVRTCIYVEGVALLHSHDGASITVFAQFKSSRRVLRDIVSISPCLDRRRRRRKPPYAEEEERALN